MPESLTAAFGSPFSLLLHRTRFLLSRLMIYSVLSLSFSFHRTQSPSILSFDPSLSLSPSLLNACFYSTLALLDPTRSRISFYPRWLDKRLLFQFVFFLPLCSNASVVFPTTIFERFSFSLPLCSADFPLTRIVERVESSQAHEKQASCDVRMYVKRLCA